MSSSIWPAPTVAASSGFELRPDAVVFKAGTNVFSSLIKWLAFGLVAQASAPLFSTRLHRQFHAFMVKVGAGTQGFMSELELVRAVKRVF